MHLNLKVVKSVFQKSIILRDEFFEVKIFYFLILSIYCIDIINFMFNLNILSKPLNLENGLFFKVINEN
jgi:hypothetical protein